MLIISFLPLITLNFNTSPLQSITTSIAHYFKPSPLQSLTPSIPHHFNPSLLQSPSPVPHFPICYVNAMREAYICRPSRPCLLNRWGRRVRGGGSCQQVWMLCKTSWREACSFSKGSVGQKYYQANNNPLTVFTHNILIEQHIMNWSIYQFDAFKKLK